MEPTEQAHREYIATMTHREYIATMALKNLTVIERSQRYWHRANFFGVGVVVIASSGMASLVVHQLVIGYGLLPAAFICMGLDRHYRLKALGVLESWKKDLIKMNEYIDTIVSAANDNNNKPDQK